MFRGFLRHAATQRRRISSHMTQPQSFPEDAQHAGGVWREQRCTPYENMFDAASEVMLCIDVAQRLVYANAAASRAFGYSPGEFDRLPLESLIPEPERVRHAALVNSFLLDPGAVPRAMAAGRVVGARRKDGSVFPFEVTLTRLAAADAPWVAAIGRDVTEREAAAAQLAAQRDELRHRAIVLQSMREAERGRIARELHENLGQSIAAMNLDIAWIAQHAAADVSGLDARLQQMRSCVDTVVGALRRLSSELRPLMLDDLGLAATLEWLANQAWQRHGIRVDVHCAIDDSRLGEPVHSSLYRVAEEILRYLGSSGAVRKATLVVEQAGDMVQVGIEADARPPADASPVAGLMSVQERVTLLGGRIEVEDAAHGMAVRVRFPLPSTGATGEAMGGAAGS